MQTGNKDDVTPTLPQTPSEYLPEDALPADVRELLRALPTKDEILGMFARLEETHRR